MKMTMSEYDFVNEFVKVRPSQFSRDALFMLFDWLEEQERACETEFEFDPIAVCCEYAELTPEEISRDYQLDEHEDVLEFLDMSTQIVGETSKGTIIFRQF
jgi:hypothetical protein